MNSMPFSERLWLTMNDGFGDPQKVIGSRLEESEPDVYLNPFLYALITAAFLALVANLILVFPDPAGALSNSESYTESDELFAAAFIETLERIGLKMNTVWLGFLNLLLIPVLALSGLFFFKHSHPGYYRHLVLNGYAAGHANLALLILIPVWRVFEEQLYLPAVHLYPAVFLTGMILLFIYQRYFGLNRLGDWLRACSALIAGYFVYSLLSGFVVAMVALFVHVMQAVMAAG